MADEQEPNFDMAVAPVYGPAQARKTFVLCFDGTGNKFSGTASDSNILKIFRMLDRTDPSHLHYYQVRQAMLSLIVGKRMTIPPTIDDMRNTSPRINSLEARNWNICRDEKRLSSHRGVRAFQLVVPKGKGFCSRDLV